LDEAISYFQDSSRNNLAHALGNRAAVLAYLGRFPESAAAFKEAIDLLSNMGDERGLIDFYLAWGYDYSSQLGEWTAARQQFSLAQELIKERLDSYVEEQARLFIGLGQVELRSGEFQAAETFFRQARELVETKELAWWRPVVYYFIGLTKLAHQEKGSARDYLQKALAAIEDEQGCPDYLCLILLELAQLESNEQQKLLYLEQCIQAAQSRARFLDRKNTLATAGAILATCNDFRLRDLGERSLSLAV
jgi:tetratricopeptide (TPR) repeat protein